MPESRCPSPAFDTSLPHSSVEQVPSHPAQSPMAAAPDTLFLDFQRALAGQYSIERELGRGGMGVVYLAREVRLDRPVAIKVLPPALAARGDLRERFLREARTAARLSHPNVVPIFRVDEAGEFVYFAMAFVDGETLGERIRGRGPVTPHEGARVLREVAWALAYAHRGGVVHRDVKPDNILLERGSGRALVSDFGIAWQTTGVDQGPAAGPSFSGTPYFMSPEQALGEPVDGRSDLYSLGVVAYLMLSGRLPFEAATAQQAVAMSVTRDAPPLAAAAPGLPARLALAIDRCLARDPGARWPSAEAFAEALEQSAERPRDIPAPIRVWLSKSEGQQGRAQIAAGLYVTAGLTTGAVAAGAPIIAAAVPFAIGGLVGTMLLSRVRRVLAAGYGLEDIRLGLRQHVERRREEIAFEYGPEPSTLMRRIRTGFYCALGSLVVGTMGAAVIGAHPSALAVAATIATTVAGGIGFARLANAIRDSRVRRFGGWRLKFWNGKAGERAIRLAGFGLRHRALPGEAMHHPTEVVIGRATEGLLAKLPKAQRQELRGVGEIVRRLEEHAGSVRAHIVKLDESLAELAAHRPGSESRSLGAGDPSRAPGTADAVRRQHDDTLARVRAAKQEAESRLAQIVASLESIRLHLLRLHAGAGSVRELTVDLDAAAAIDSDLARSAEAQREVESMLGERPPSPGIERALPSPV